MFMTTVEAITAAIAELPPEQVAQIREWLNEQDEAEWDAQIERDERAGRLDALADRALADYRAGRTRPL
jgi:enoyl-CoA hydratase/carnithine racemase